MKVLVVYDSVSPMKITAKVAETIAEALKEKGIDTDYFYVEDLLKSTIKNYDCLVVGAPTMAFRASRRITKFLNSLPKEDFSSKTAAAFDTQIQSRFSGNAAKGIEGRLKDLNFKLITAPLIAYVEGKGNEWRLKDGELEKAKNWAQDFAEALTK